MQRPFAEYRPIGPFAQKSASQSKAFYGDNLTVSVVYEPSGSGQIDIQQLERLIENGRNSVNNVVVNKDNASKYFQVSSAFDVIYAQTGHAYLNFRDVENISLALVSAVNENGHEVKPDNLNTFIRENYFVGEGP